MLKKRTDLYRNLSSTDRFIAVLAGLGIVGGVLVRAINLTTPSGKIFDEVYFPVFAQNYIDHTYFFDVHPPLGKLFISIGLLLFGNNPLGWRIMPLIVGIAMIGLGAALAYKAYKSRFAALVMAFFIAVDGIFIVYSRTGLMDIILTFTIFLCLLLAYRMKSWWQVFAVVTVLGLAISIKWPALGIIVPVTWLAWRQRSHKKLLCLLPWALVVYVVIFMVGQFLLDKPLTYYEFLLWNAQAFTYHEGLQDTHPWGSLWWSWPLLKRPVLFWYETPVEGRVQAIWAMGNPILWWSSSLVVAMSTIHICIAWLRKSVKADHPLIVPLLGYFALYMPWMLIHRVVFLYHYVPAYVCALMMVVYWLNAARKRYETAVTIFLMVIIWSSVLYMPVFCGWVVPEAWVRTVMWVKTWW